MYSCIGHPRQMRSSEPFRRRVFLVQLPDGNHRALEVQDFKHDTFAALITDALQSNDSHIMLPSNLVLMHQAATWVYVSLAEQVACLQSTALPWACVLLF